MDKFFQTFLSHQDIVEFNRMLRNRLKTNQDYPNDLDKNPMRLRPEICLRYRADQWSDADIGAMSRLRCGRHGGRQSNYSEDRTAAPGRVFDPDYSLFQAKNQMVD